MVLEFQVWIAKHCSVFSSVTASFTVSLFCDLGNCICIDPGTWAIPLHKNFGIFGFDLFFKEEHSSLMKNNFRAIE
jgi:hypothetical protein